MSRRDHVAARCPTCRMYATLCICTLTPRLATRTRVHVLVHYDEARKPTNTGQLAARALVNSELGIVGDLARPLTVSSPGAEVRALLLFPAADATPLTALPPDDRATVLFVPDGNWRQAAKMRRRIAALAGVPCVTLPDHDTAYRLRAEPRAGGMATLEAIAHALAIVEPDRAHGAEVAAHLLRIFRIMVERTLWLRGAIPDREVTDGIPPAALAELRRRGDSRGS
jgi:DTW domain-containing protein